ncbi:MAG: NADH:ubiquinone reductase (Na(+)-transporting) subunit B [Verrucomicrobiales bacterium]|nr:NADH:ubiquinone reductase (Na(+)-transporting) subunit B [Verrucomicrobiales bacterium]
MKPVRNLLDNAAPLFEKGGKLERLYPLYEAIDTMLYSPASKTTGAPHVRDAIDLKRIMALVVIALLPCTFMAFWNTGLQANGALAAAGTTPEGWRASIFAALGLAHDPGSFIANVVYGGLFFLPVYIVTMTVGGFWEVLFATFRRHEVNEGFLVTGLLFPLTLPPTIPLWQVALGISFGVVIGKEIFGGTGRNLLNPALTARAFLYFAYPAQSTGDSIWTAVDGFSGATPLGAIATAPVDNAMASVDVTWIQAFLGTTQGSMGETSALACLLGATFLIATGIGSWRIMLSMVTAAVVSAYALHAIGSPTNPAFQLPPHWHLVVGSLAFGAVFMATDPVSATMTNPGRWIYGTLIGVLTVLIRVVNPAYPEGVMLAVLLGNVFAPAIDYPFVQANINRRLNRQKTA